MSFNGTVQRIFSNPVRGKMLHSFTLRGEKGFFNMGDNTPEFKEGSSLSFEAVPSQRPGNHEVTKGSIVINTDKPVTDYSMAGARKNTVLQKDDYWNNREARDIETQKRIEIQAARNTAVEILKLAGMDFKGDSGACVDSVDALTSDLIENTRERLTV